MTDQANQDWLIEPTETLMSVTEATERVRLTVRRTHDWRTDVLEARQNAECALADAAYALDFWHDRRDRSDNPNSAAVVAACDAYRVALEVADRFEDELAAVVANRDAANG
tara:strand:+ start:1095 stop:1427 length:333 start_codon:yes stop_codon:yes gene_type:complete